MNYFGIYLRNKYIVYTDIRERVVQLGKRKFIK